MLFFTIIYFTSKMSTALKSQFADMNFFKALGVEKSAS